MLRTSPKLHHQGPPHGGEDVLFSVVMRSNEVEPARVSWIYPGICGSLGIVVNNALPRCLSNDCDTAV